MRRDRFHSWLAKLRVGGVLSLGQFERLNLLGAGQFGVVVSARDSFLNRPVALKIPIDQERSFEFLVSEARVLARLSNPNILKIYGAHRESIGFRKEIFFFSTELASAGSLTDFPRRRLTEQELVALFLQLASALSAAHGAGLLHRDVKPDNILCMSRRRFPEEVRLGDFGIAAPATNRRELAGTILFMAPEQYEGLNLPQSDVYSLGQTMYWAATMQSPFVATDFENLLREKLNISRDSHRQHLGHLSRDLSDIIFTCIEPHYSKRFASGSELMAHLQRFQQVEPSKAAENAHKENFAAPSIKFIIAASDLLTQHVDAIAYSANNHLAMKAGVSKAIREAAGKELETAARQKRRTFGPTGVPVGRAVVTSSFRMRQSGIKRIIHSPSLHYDRETKEYRRESAEFYLDDISNAVEAACRTADESELVHSLATHLFGLRVGPRMFPELSSSTLVAANIRGFQRFLLARSATSLATRSSLERLILTIFEPGRSDETARLGTLVEQELRRIQIRTGSMFESNVQALVISANNWLRAGSGTAKEAIGLGGPKVEQSIKRARNQHADLNRGDVVPIPGGKLEDAVGNRRILLHAVGTVYKREPGSDKSVRLPASPSDIYQLTCNCLKWAFDSGVKSLAFVPMCARPGYSTLPDGAAMQTMIRTQLTAMNDLRPVMAGRIDRIELFVDATHRKLVESFSPML